MSMLNKLFIGVVEYEITVVFGMWSTWSVPYPKASVQTPQGLILQKVILQFVRSPDKRASPSGISLALTCE